MTVDDEAVKNVTQTVAAGGFLAMLVALGRWVWSIGGLPRRVARIEGRVVHSDGVLLALADCQLASTEEDKRESRDRLREAKEAMIEGILKEEKKR